MKRILPGLIFTLMSAPVLAQSSDTAPPWYEVEIIVFENTDPDSMTLERWPLQVESPDLNNAIELFAEPPLQAETSAHGTDTPYLILPPDQYQLANTYQKLQDSGQYRPLLHLAWRQIVPPREQPDRIHIHGPLSPANAVAEPTTETDANVTEQSAEEIPAIDTVDGIISIGLGRYLHVNADLMLYKPQTETAGANETASLFSTMTTAPFIFKGELDSMEEESKASELFRIQGNLRMRSKEVHYLDHPLLGMLILFTPYTPPESQESEDEPEAIQPSEIAPVAGPDAQPGREKEDRSF